MADKISSISKLIDQFSDKRIGPDNLEMRIIDGAGVQAIASKTKTALLEIETRCLSMRVVPVRYLRNIGTIGIDGQHKLLCSKVTVCGAGGLGGTIIELLARQGIGHLVIIDNGTFAETDLNRQIMATQKDLDKSKVNVTAKRVHKINAAINVTAVDKTINSTTAAECIKGADVVMDALDNVETRRAVAEACRECDIPFVHGAIAGFSGQLMTIFPENKGLDVVYDISNPKSSRGIETIAGTPANTPMIIAALEVQEAIKIITGIGEPVKNRLVFLDIFNIAVHEMRLDD